MKPYVLVVEDEEAISMMVQYNLEKQGFEVKVVEDGEDAIYETEERMPDIILLDWMLPSLSGIQICERLRARDEGQLVPIIMLTARGEETDRIRGLDSGADDYIAKPFSPAELVARINALLRRSRPVLTKKCLSYKGLDVNLEQHRVMYKDRPIRLGPTEFKLLCHIMEHPGKVYTRDQLLDNVWGHDVYVETRTVDVHIRRLRKALSQAGLHVESFIQTVRGAGYKFEEPDDE